MNKLYELIIQKIDANVLLCFILGMGIVLVYLMDIGQYNISNLNMELDEYVFVTRGTDMSTSMEQAREVLKGEWPDKPFFRAPLYSYVLALFILFGKNTLSVSIFQAIFAVATIILVFHCGKLLFNPQSGVVAAVLLSLYGGYIYWVAIPASAIMEAFFTVLSMYLLLRLRKAGSVKFAILTGVAGGALCLIRPNFLAIFPIVYLFVCCEYFYRKLDNRKALTILGTGLICFTLVLIPPITWNNIASKDGDIILMPNTHGKMNFRISNRYDSTISNPFSSKGEIMPLTSFAFWKHQVNKCIAYWKNLEIPQNINFYIFREKSDILKMLFINFGFISALFLVSSVFYVKQFMRYWPVYVYVYAYSATIILFFIIGRFRIPVVPLMAVMGGGFIVETGRRLFSKSANQKSNRKTTRTSNFMHVRKKNSVISLIALLVVFILTDPFSSMITRKCWQAVAVTEFLKLNISGYREAKLRMTEFQEENSKSRIFYVAGSALAGDFKSAREHLDFLKKYSKIPQSYLDCTERDINILENIRMNNENKKSWLKHVNSGTGGHVVSLYKNFESVVQDRKRLKLSVPHDFNASSFF